MMEDSSDGDLSFDRILDGFCLWFDLTSGGYSRLCEEV